MDTNVKICEPRCFYVEPHISRSEAQSRAGAYADKIFRLKSLLRRGKSNVRLIERRLMPFWNVRCTSHFHYDRASSYSISPEEKDALELTIQTADGQSLVMPVENQAKDGSITLEGMERCLKERDVSEAFDASKPAESKSIAGKVGSIFKRGDQKKFKKYLDSSATQIEDVEAFNQTQTLNGLELFSDIADERIHVVVPGIAVNNVVSDVMKKVLVSIDPIKIHDWSLAAEIADLYYRPSYGFEFERLDKDGNVVEVKYELLDGITGDWDGISALEEAVSENVAWDQIMQLSIDTEALVMQEVGRVFSESVD